jgi:hypothetical protein
MAAPATVTMLMIVAMVVLVAMLVVMGVVMAVMSMRVTVMPMVVIAVMGAALRFEGALHRHCRAALSTHQFGEGRGVLDIESIAGDFGRTVLAAEMPGKTQETKRVFGPHLQQRLGGGLYLDEAPILQAQGIAIVDGGFHVEVEQDLGSALSSQRRLTTVARLVVEGHRIDDTISLHGGLADNGGNAGHGFVSVSIG